MASKSTKSKNSSKELTVTKSPVSLQTDDDESDEWEDDDEDDSDDNANEYYTDLFRFCDEYFFGIKTSEIWKTPSLNRTKSTYFILPEASEDYEMIVGYASMEMIKPTRGDFEKFWFDLSDLHKDRYLLVNYMAIYNDGIRKIEEMLVSEIKDPWNGNMSNVCQVIRGYVMEKNKSKFRRGGGALSLLINGHCGDDLIDALAPELESLPPMKFSAEFKPRFEIFKTAVKCLRPSVLIVTFVMHVFAGFVNTYFAWVSYDAQNMRRYAMELDRKGESVVDCLLDGDTRMNDRIDFMRKLKLAAPRWSQSDRRMMLDAIETNGQSCRGTYVQVLLREVGVDKFKKLVFGKQHFCAHCRRSSYTGEDRMMACKRCDTEGVRPRAWYCDRECQKADWRRHRANKHPTIVVEKKACMHPTVVVEKKADKKKKRKPLKK